MHANLDPKFAMFLRQRRGAATYAQFARKLGISASTLHRLENGQQSATLARLEQILGRLKCRISDALPDED
ncbi:MAG: helix-turn-helix domain-containing protein [Limisphaerales bacterium]